MVKWHRCVGALGNVSRERERKREKEMVDMKEEEKVTELKVLSGCRKN